MNQAFKLLADKGKEAKYRSKRFTKIKKNKIQQNIITARNSKEDKEKWKGRYYV